MEDYDLKRRLKHRMKSEPVQRALKTYFKSFLNGNSLKNFKKIDTNNHRLEAIKNEILKDESWKLLWLPPSAPYYHLSGTFKDLEKSDLTKSLIFSSWKVVPRSISTLLSHEAEGLAYKFVGKTDFETSSILLPITVKDNNYSLRSFLVLYPSLFLSEAGDVFKLDVYNLDLKEIKARVKKKILNLLTKVIANYGNEGEKEDPNWYWAAPILLDRENPDSKVVGKWLDKFPDKDYAWLEDTKKEKEGEHGYKHLHVLKIKDVFLNGTKLGKVPDDLLDVMVLIALASPANVIFRSLRNISSASIRQPEFHQISLLSHAAKCAMAMRTLFNTNEAHAIITGHYKGLENHSHKVLQYCLDGCFQSVCDEYFHIIKLSEGLHDGVEAYDDKTSDYYPYTLIPVCDIFCEVVSQKEGGVKVDIFNEDPETKKIVMTPQHVGCRFALSYGNSNGTDGKVLLRAEGVRNSFNSPFRPFVLATTSIGQEGLDFHQYCHSIFHWNLPRNPVDLEQREGRIHRFKSHVIRKNVASCFEIMKQKGGDPWDIIFEEAKKAKTFGSNDIIPYWIYEARFKIKRNVPIIPFSRDEQHFDDLLKTLANYRLAFGQPRQEELLKILDENAEIDPAQLKKLMIDLSPK